MSDYLKVYRERFWSLWNLLKKFLLFVFPPGIKECNGSCDQGRLPCDCGEYGQYKK